MSQTLLEMAKDLVAELIRVHGLEPDEARSLLQSTHVTLLGMHQVEATDFAVPSSPPGGAVAPGDWRKSITQHAVSCLECGATFKQLSAHHLRQHDLTPKTYRVKYGVPRTQSLSARKLMSGVGLSFTVRRRALAKQIRPWEKASTSRAAAKAEAVEGGRQRQ